jgi:hypothetical protein
LATRLFFLGPNFAKNRPEVKKIAFWRNFASKKNARQHVYMLHVYMDRIEDPFILAIRLLEVVLAK